MTLETTDGPELHLVRAIDKRLADFPCLSEIQSMRREYRYGMRNGQEIREKIDVRVQEDGWDDLPSGIFVMGIPERFAFDSRSYFVAYATYHIESDELDIWACGDNAAGNSPIRQK